MRRFWWTATLSKRAWMWINLESNHSGRPYKRAFVGVSVTALVLRVNGVVGLGVPIATQEELRQVFRPGRHTGRASGLRRGRARPLAGPRSVLHRLLQETLRAEPLGSIRRQSGPASGTSQGFRHRSRLLTMNGPLSTLPPYLRERRGRLQGIHNGRDRIASKSSESILRPPPRFKALARCRSLDKKRFRAVSRKERNRPRSESAARR
jgi:hypothetical protein